MLVARRMEADDRTAVAAIERLCFSCPESESALALYDGVRGDGVVVTEIREQTHLCTACIDADDAPVILAYGTMFFAPDEGQIINIATHPDHRRRGAAGLVLKRLIAEARERGLIQLSLEVRVSNEPAIALYTAHGFTVAGRRKHFYRCPNEDAFVMLKVL